MCVDFSKLNEHYFALYIFHLDIYKMLFFI